MYIAFCHWPQLGFEMRGSVQSFHAVFGGGAGLSLRSHLDSELLVFLATDASLSPPSVATEEGEAKWQHSGNAAERPGSLPGIVCRKQRACRRKDPALVVWWQERRALPRLLQ